MTENPYEPSAEANDPLWAEVIQPLPPKPTNEAVELAIWLTIIIGVLAIYFAQPIWSLIEAAARSYFGLSR